MLRMALIHVSSRAVAEEVVQDCWLIVLRDLDRYEGRSSLRTWVLGIVVNLARSRGRAERRCTPIGESLEAPRPLFASGRFRPLDDRWPRHWAIGPTRWPTPVLHRARSHVRKAIEDYFHATEPT